MNALSRVFDASVFLDGASLIGIAAEADLPTITMNQATHSALGMIGEFNTFTNLSAMTMRIKWEGQSKDVAVKLYNPYKTLDIQLRSLSEEYDGSLLPVAKSIVNFVKGRVQETTPGNFAVGSSIDTETTFSVDAFKQVIDGVTVVEIDILNNIWRVDGVDILADRNRLLGR